MDSHAPAFPNALTFTPNGDVATVGQYYDKEGVSIRAYIATKAMAAMINAEWVGAGNARIDPQRVAKEACAYADALIVELSKS